MGTPNPTDPNETQESRRAQARDVFWTGGWDSTFRILELLCVQDCPVQPHYLVDPERASTLYEFRAMSTISSMARKRLPRNTLLCPTRITLISEIPEIAEIRAQFRRLRSRLHVGTQYEWLAEYCVWKGIQSIDVCMTRFDEMTPLQQQACSFYANEI